MRTAIMMAMLGAATAAGAASVKTADYQFDYTYPADAARIPAVRRWLDAESARLRAKTVHDAAQARREARGAGFPFRPYSTEKTWKRVADTPRFLSLSSDSYVYTGGAHGQPASGALLWDKAAGRILDSKAVFTSPAAVQAALGADFCARLKMLRTRRVGGAIASQDISGQCPATRELTLLLGSSSGRAIDRIGLIADPYVAGSYAEGAYEVTLPVTAKVIAAVRPAYRSAFAPGR